MRYERVAAYVAEQAWAILPAKLHEIVDVLSFRAAGGDFTPAEIRARIGDARPSIGPSTRGAVGVIPLRGVIAHRMSAMDESSGGMSVERFASMFRQLMANEAVGTILIDIDSPGGTVAGVPELFAEIYAARGQKRIVAHVCSLAASAAYWLACAAEEIIVTPSGSVGSIGVFSAHQDLSVALEKEGVKVTLISAGKYKTEGSPFAPLTPEAKALRQAQVNEAYGWFVHDVGRGRGLSASAVRNGYGEGRVVTAAEAKGLGMVDGVGTIDATLAQIRVTPTRSLRASSDQEAARRARYGLTGHVSALSDDERRRRLALW